MIGSIVRDVIVNPVKSVMEVDFLDRIHTPNAAVCSYDAAAQKMDEWKQEGHTTIFNAGSFDVLTLNHVLSLIECRMLGAMAVLGIDTIGDMTQQHAVAKVAQSDALRLMVTLDTNKAIAEGKSRQVSKGGAPKPILDWSTRSAMLAAQSIPVGANAIRRNAVDYITRHGSGCCLKCPAGTCNNEDNAVMAVNLQPGVVVVNEASTNTLDHIVHFKQEGLLPRTSIAIIREEDNQYFDAILGEAVKTSSIIKRIRS